MNRFKSLALAAVAGVCLAATAPAEAQVTIGIGVGVAPVCPYGYYDYAPYACSPYGDYGPEWFNGGVFIGAGRWFHGPANFHGHVNNHFDARRGYKGRVPNRGERAAPGNRAHFRGNEVRDGRGHAGGNRR